VRSPIPIVLTLAGLLLAPLAPAAETRPDRGFTIDKLADGVYAVIRREPPGLATHANNVFIVNDEDVMVVDTSQSPALTREVLAVLRTITSKPVRYVINTHWHDDHYIGDQVYREAFPDVDIVAHAQTFRDLPVEGARNRAQMINGLPSMIAQLKDARPYVIVGAFVIAAVVTPPDVLSQFMLAVPMCLLYEAGLFFARFVVVRRAEQTAEPAETQ